MNIVILDGYTLNPGDLNWNELRSLGNCMIHDRTKPNEIIERAQHAEILLTNKTVLSREIIFQLPNVKYIGLLSTGVNVVDVIAAKKKYYRNKCSCLQHNVGSAIGLCIVI